MNDFQFVSREELAKPKEGHALIHLDMWCVANEEGDIAVYKDYYIQGNKNRALAERCIRMVPEGTHVTLVPVIILRDSIGRYAQ